MLLRIKRLSRGFTLIESLIVLVITCSIISFPIIELKGYRDNLTLINTRAQVKSAINFCLKESIINKRVYFIRYSETSNKLKVMSDWSTAEKTFLINSQVKISNIDNLTIKKKSYVAPRTIYFKCGKITKRMTVQLMWGRLIEK